MLHVDHAYQPHLPLTTSFLFMHTTTHASLIYIVSIEIGKMQIQRGGYVLYGALVPYVITRYYTTAWISTYTYAYADAILCTPIKLVLST